MATGNYCTQCGHKLTSERKLMSNGLLEGDIPDDIQKDGF